MESALPHEILEWENFVKDSPALTELLEELKSLIENPQQFVNIAAGWNKHGLPVFYLPANFVVKPFFSNFVPLDIYNGYKYIDNYPALHLGFNISKYFNRISLLVKNSTTPSGLINRASWRLLNGVWQIDTSCAYGDTPPWEAVRFFVETLVVQGQGQSRELSYEF